MFYLDFNGTSGYGARTDTATTRLETNDAFSWAGWVRLDSYNNNVLPRIWEKRANYLCVMGDSGNGRYRNLGLEVSNAEGTGPNGGVSEFWGDTQLDISVWYHVAVTFDITANPEGVIYLNGNAETMTELFAWQGTLQDTSTRPLYFCRRTSDLNRNLNGQLRGPIGFWQRALTAVEVSDLYGGDIPSGAAMLLLADEGTGTTLQDSTANNNDVTLTSVAWDHDTYTGATIALLGVT